MTDYKRGSHTIFSIHLHIVWVTKYRRKILRGDIANRVRDIIREECRKKKVDILKGHVSSNHVHVMVSIPPQVAVSRLVQQMKGKSAYLLLAEFSHIRKQFWGRHLWAKCYFARSSGLVTDEIVYSLYLTSST